MSTAIPQFPTLISTAEAQALRSLRSGDLEAGDAFDAGERLAAVRHICEASGPHLRLDVAAPGLMTRHDLYPSRYGLARISSGHDDAEAVVAPVPLLPGILARLIGLAPTAAPDPSVTLGQVPVECLDAVFEESPARSEAALAYIARNVEDPRAVGTHSAPLRRLFRLRRTPAGAGPTVIGGILGATSMILIKGALRPASSTELFRAVFTAARPSRSR
ncbi:hypothetical protein [Brachybacterium sp. NPDC056505]|uniref:hypothetical protein n=1 Tax=Brachybacterium sp. NPDC056505 TaxID=3345843 RepID=UPI00366DC01E